MIPNPKIVRRSIEWDCPKARRMGFFPILVQLPSGDWVVHINKEDGLYTIIGDYPSEGSSRSGFYSWLRSWEKVNAGRKQVPRVAGSGPALEAVADQLVASLDRHLALAQTVSDSVLAAAEKLDQVTDRLALLISMEEITHKKLSEVVGLLT